MSRSLIIRPVGSGLFGTPSVNPPGEFEETLSNSGRGSTFIDNTDPQAVIWFSDWESAALGSAGQQDGGKWTTTSGSNEDFLHVIEPASIPGGVFPVGITRALRCQYTQGSSRHAIVDFGDNPYSGGSLNLLSPGQSFYYRFYYRIDTAGPNRASHYDNVDAFGYRNLTIHTPQTTSGVYEPVMRTEGIAYPFNRWIIEVDTLSREVWYRLEFHIEILRTTLSHGAPQGTNHAGWTDPDQIEFRCHPRFYLGHSTTILRDASHYRSRDYPADGGQYLDEFYADGKTFVTDNALKNSISGQTIFDDFRRLSIGNNGASAGNAPETDGSEFYYYAKVAVGTEGWIGPA